MQYIMDFKKSLNFNDSKKYSLKTYSINITNNKKYKNGDYIIIEYNKDYLYNNVNLIEKCFSNTLKYFLKKYKYNKVLIIGLGNPYMIGDTLGQSCTNKLIATNKYNFLTIPKVILFNPNVVSNTGIDSFNIIKSIVTLEEPNLIIIIDSMSTNYINNLNYSIEINDCGFISSNSINNNRNIDKDTFNIPIITIGIPLIYQSNKNYLMDSNIKDILDKSSDLISNVIKKVLY